MSITATAYFPSAGSVSVTPAYESWWSEVSSAQRLPLVFGSPSGTPFQSVTASGSSMPAWSGVSVYARVLLAQFVSEPLPAGSSVSAQVGQWLMRANGSITGGATPKQHFAFAYKFVSANGLVSRGAHRYLNIYPTTNAHEWTGTLTVYNVAASSVSGSAPWTAQDQDRLVIEVGYSIRQSTSAAVTGYSGTIELGGSGEDLQLSVNEQKNSWDLIRIPSLPPELATFEESATFNRAFAPRARPEVYGPSSTPTDPFLNEAAFQ